MKKVSFVLFIIIIGSIPLLKSTVLSNTEDWMNGILNERFQTTHSEDIYQKLSNEMYSNISDWYVIGLSQSGMLDEKWYYRSVFEERIVQKYKEPNKLGRNTPTEWHRAILTALALGLNPTSIRGINLVNDGIIEAYTTGQMDRQGLNAYVFGLIALDAYYINPSLEAVGIRQELIRTILSYELTGGGFSYGGETPDSDMTAMVLQALSAHYWDTTTYSYHGKYKVGIQTNTISMVIDRALDILSNMQQEAGDFSSYSIANAESTAQVLIALVSLGINPLEDTRFIKNGQTILNGLEQYRMQDGSFRRSTVSNAIASWQVFASLVAFNRYQTGKRAFFDFYEEFSTTDMEKLSYFHSLDENIIPTVEDVMEIKMRYEELSIDLRRYVYTFPTIHSWIVAHDLEWNMQYKYEEIKDFVVWQHPFTDDDYQQYQQLIEHYTISMKNSAIRLQRKAEESPYFSNQEQIIVTLQDILDEISIIEDKINELNEKIVAELVYRESYDKQTIIKLYNDYQALTEEERVYVIQEELLLSAYTTIRINQRTTTVTVSVAGIALLSTIFYFAIKTKRKKVQVR